MTRVRRQYYRQARFSEGTSTQWAAENPVLYLGEPAWSSDTNEIRVGDGVSHWADLDAISGGGGGGAHSDLTGLTSGDDHTQYRLESEDHTHASTGAQAGNIAGTSVTVDSTNLDGTATNVQAVLEELETQVQSAASTHAAAVDPHTGYRLESADHSHASTGAQAGNIAATAVTVDSTNLDGTATNVQTVLEELETQVQTAASTHAGAVDPHTVYRLESEDHSHASTGAQAGNIAATAVTVDSTNLDGTATTVQAVFEELETQVQTAASTHAGAADPHTGYRLESADHTHASTGAQAGQLTVAALSDAPAGELGGTWASPTVDATHSGSTHSAATDTHIADTGDAHDASAISFDDTGLLIITTTNVQDAMEELDAAAGGGASAAVNVTVDDTDFEELAGSDAQTIITEIDSALQEVRAALEDTEVAVDEHIAATDPHHGYLKESDLSVANAVDLTDGGATTLHSHAGGSGHTIQDDNSSQTTRTNLSFQDGFVVTDDAGGDQTEIDVSYGGAGYPLDVADAESDGTAITVARSDHVHAHGALSSPSSAHDAADIDVADSGGYFTGTEVETALAELGAVLASPGGAWDLVVDQDGTSFAAWTAVDGTWSSASSVIKQTDASANFRDAYYTAKVNTAIMVYEADIQIKSSGGGNTIGGMLLGFDGSALGGFGVRLDNDANQVLIDSEGATASKTISQTINIDTWYNVRVWVTGGNSCSVYLDGVLIGSGRMDASTIQMRDTTYIGLYTYQSEVWFRNIKVWNLAGPATDIPRTVTIGTLINGGGAVITTGVHPVWRAPYACTVTAVRGYVDTGTTTVINAAKLGTGDFCSADITINPSDAWENGTVDQNATLAAGDTVSVEVVTAGTATELTVQVDATRV